MNSMILICLLLLMPYIAEVNAQNSPCEAQTEYRQFDFWIGEWEVLNIQGQKAGDSSIQRTLNGCAIMEHWISANPAYEGKSINFYNSQTGLWHQQWIDNQGVPISFSGTFVEDEQAMKLTSTISRPDGQNVLYKLEFYKVSEEEVRQWWQQSNDDGETWSTLFDGYYHRKKS